MEENPPDALLKEIVERLKEKPKSPKPEWYGDLTKLLCFAPLKLRQEKPVIAEDRHPYLIFELPDPREIPDVDYSQFIIEEQSMTIIEMQCGALIQNDKGENIWTFSLGALVNLLIEKNPYKTKDPRDWGEIDPNEKNIVFLGPKDSQLPESIIAAIHNELNKIRPPIRRWGMIRKKGAGRCSMYVELPLKKSDASPEPILKHLQWFTPFHFCWIGLEPTDTE